MNYNIITYVIYTIIMSIIIIQVGLICYRNGTIWIKNLIPENPSLSIYTNNILLAGYYLVNIGYSIFMIASWEEVSSPTSIIGTIASTSGSIILLLAILHYFNIIIIRLFIVSKNQQL